MRMIQISSFGFRAPRVGTCDIEPYSHDNGSEKAQSFNRARFSLQDDRTQIHPAEYCLPWLLGGYVIDTLIAWGRLASTP